MKTIICIMLLLPTIAMAGEGSFISCLCAGGKVDGAGTGVKVLRDGHIFRIVKHKNFPTPIEIPAGVNPAAAAKIFTLAETNGFLDSTNNRGKCFITYHSTDKDHIVQKSSHAPQPVKDLFAELQTVHRSLAGK